MQASILLYDMIYSGCCTNCMTSIADIIVPADAFELGRLLDRLPGASIELAQLVPLENSIIPLFWVVGGDPAEIQSILRESPLTESVEHIVTDERRNLFSVEWNLAVNGLIELLVDTDAKVLEAQNMVDGWEFRIQFPTHEALSTFRARCEEASIPLVLRRLYNQTEPLDNIELMRAREDQAKLTSAQRDALAVAYEQGYFDVPRDTTVTELAAQFDISDNAFSQRLRRGMRTLVHDVIISE